MNTRSTKHLSTSFLIKKIYKEYISLHSTTIIYALIMMVIAAAATGFHAWLVQPALDDVLINSNKKMLLIIPLVIIITTFIKGISTYIHDVQINLIAHKVIAKLQNQMFSKLMFVNLSFYNDAKSGNIISRIINDTNYLRIPNIKTKTRIFKHTLIIVFLIGNMFYQSWQLALFSFFAFPLAIWPIVKIGNKIRNVSYATQDEVGSFTNILSESVKGIRIIKAYCRQNFALDRALKAINNIKYYFIKSAKVSSRISPIMEFIGSLAVSVAIWGGGTLILNESMTTGQFMSFLVSLLLAYKPVKSLGNLNKNLQEGLAGAQRIFNLIETKDSNIESSNKNQNFEIKKGEIIFKDISFAYEKQKNLFENFSIKISAGTKVAIVGPTGSGKSTLVNLILRFYDPQKGEILIDDNNIKEISTNSLRQQISLVSQDTNLFNDSVMNNIKFGNLLSDFEEITIASKNAESHEFIEELPDKYNTIVGENGVKLSGGQKQRIAIARALIKDSPILLLDEATSSLDNITEKDVQGAINLLMKNRTSLIVAHRLSTIENADFIYVLDKGKIVESGKHKDLILNNGLYKKLYQQQDD